jgi:hypothetical protein
MRRLGPRKRVGEGVKLGDGGVEAEAFDAHGHVADGLVHLAQEVLVVLAGARRVHLRDPITERPDAAEVLEAASAPEAVHSTSRSGGRIAQHEPARGVGAVGR